MVKDIMEFISAHDPEVGAAIRAEYDRQRRNIELIASENFVSEAVLAAAGTVLTNKYAEGYPGKRYYGGCQCVDVVEDLARERAKKLFGADHANVQPHSGANANYAVYAALCEQMGLTPASADELVLREVEGFYGSYYSKCKKAGTEPDTLSFYDQPFTIHTEVLNVNMEMEEKDNWYNEEQLSARDKYGALLWGNYGLTVLSKEEVPEDPKRLLLIKDSFSNCLAPLFLSNFDVVYIVDLRSYPSGLNGLCDEKDFDETLVLYNFENLESDTNFYRMTY